MIIMSCPVCGSTRLKPYDGMEVHCEDCRNTFNLGTTVVFKDETYDFKYEKLPDGKFKRTRIIFSHGG